MEEQGLICRHCDRPIAVPAARCPWPGCGEQIMVICAACKQYTDDREDVCQQCGAPLVEATFPELQMPAAPGTEVERLASDQARAQLVASGVIASYTTGFFYEGGQLRPELMGLLDASLTPEGRAVVILFGGIAYLVQRGYCGLKPETAREPAYRWDEVRPWDGQAHSWEGRLARQAWKPIGIHQVVKQIIAEQTGFCCRVIMEQPGVLSSQGSRPFMDNFLATIATLAGVLAHVREEMSRGRVVRVRVRDLSARPATAVVIQLGQETVLPRHEEESACRQTYRTLLDFMRADWDRARYLAEQIDQALNWFRRYEQDPQMVLSMD
jgi:hypothetical protein